MPTLAEWRYCPRCRAELAHGRGRVDCASCGFVAYANAEPTACALCVDRAGGVLLARRAQGPYRGRWDLPGGFLEEDEHPLDCIRRELREETALDVEPEEFLGVWMDRYSEDGSGPATLNFYWTARVLGGEARPADDVSELRWFRPHDLPPADEFAFHIADVLAAWRQRT